MSTQHLSTKLGTIISNKKMVHPTHSELPNRCSSVYRPSIDGLRAVAIISVVIFHAFPSWLPGGFLGVDIFFVISGYLITGIILKAQNDGGFRVFDFYSRRIKRIFPALIVVLGGCLVVGKYILLTDEYKALGKHVVAGASYVSNFLLMTESGYFDFASELKPLLHLWSLSIEEQFYLVWPLVLIIALRCKINALTATVLLLSVSFIFNVIVIENLPTEVFYLPISRAWELLVGAVLACINLSHGNKFDRIVGQILLRKPGRSSLDLPNILTWTGLALLALALFGSSKGMPIPGWWALFPTVGAVCLIAGGEEAWFSRRILASKFSVNVGLISYPLYLWHWPMLSFARIVEGQTPSDVIRIAAIAASGLLAWLTYRLVERPLRFLQHWSVPTTLITVLALLGAIGYQVYANSGHPTSDNPKSEMAARFFDAKVWESQGWNRQPQCPQIYGVEFQDYCVIFDLNTPPTVMLIGDSNANHFYPGFAPVYAKDKKNLLNVGKAGCPPLFGVNVSMKEGDLQCERVMEKALTYAIETPSVKIVLLSMMGVGYATGSRSIIRNELNFIRINYARDTSLTEPLAILDDAMRVTLRRLLTAGKQIVFIISVPMLDFDPSICVDFRPWRITQARIKTPCSIPQSQVDAVSKPYRAMVMGLKKEFPMVKVMDVARELCDGRDCWAMKGGVLLYRDPEHLSVAGSKFMGNRLHLLAVPKGSGQ